METQLLTVPYFKIKLKEKLKPKKIKHFCKGSKIGHKLPERIRLQRSDLNSHNFAIGQSVSATQNMRCHNIILWTVSYILVNVRIQLTKLTI